MINDVNGVFNGQLTGGEFNVAVGILVMMVLMFLVISLVFYILNAIALTRISKTVGFDKGWLAWVPIANGFVMPMLVENDVHTSVRGKFTLIYGLTFIGSIVLSGLLPFLAIIPGVLQYYAFFLIAKWFSEKAILHLVISIITLGISMPFSLLLFRNRKVRGKEEYVDFEEIT